MVRRAVPAALVSVAVLVGMVMALGHGRAQPLDLGAASPAAAPASQLTPPPVGLPRAVPTATTAAARAPAGPSSPVPTPDETDYEYRNRVMDAEMAYRQGITGGQLLATRDAGAKATRLASGSLRSLTESSTGLDFASVFSFADAQHGWLAARSDTQRQALLATADGGRRWTKLRDLDFVAYDLEFVTPTKGWAATAQGLFTTDDGGRTWRSMAEALPVVATVPGSFVTPGSDRLHRIDFADLQHGWGARWVPQTRKLALVRTTDGGSRWTSLPDPCPTTGPVSASDVIDLPPADHLKGIGLFSITGAMTGWLFCRGEPAPYLRGYPKHFFHTRDGGQTWRLAAEVVPPAGTPEPSPTWLYTPPPTPSPVPLGTTGALPLTEWPEDMFYLDDRLGWIGTARGSVYATHDGGRTWTELAGGEAPLDLYQFRHLHFLSPTQGYTYFGRPGGALLETRDGGRTWTQLYPPDPAEYAGLPTCRAADVHAVHAGWIGFDDASAVLTIGSRSTRPCVLQGVPTVELLGAAGEVLPHSPAPVSGYAGPVVLIQPEQRAQFTIIWRTRCHEKPVGPVTIRFWLPGQSPGNDPAVTPDYAGALELQKTPEPVKLYGEAPAAPPHLDVDFLYALDPPVTP